MSKYLHTNYDNSVRHGNLESSICELGIRFLHIKSFIGKYSNIWTERLTTRGFGWQVSVIEGFTHSLLSRHRILRILSCAFSLFFSPRPFRWTASKNCKYFIWTFKGTCTNVIGSCQSKTSMGILTHSTISNEILFHVRFIVECMWFYRVGVLQSVQRKV